MEPCTLGIAGYVLGGMVSPECVDASHCLDFYLHIHRFYRQKLPEVSLQEVAFWFENTGNLENYLYCHLQFL